MNTINFENGTSARIKHSNDNDGKFTVIVTYPDGNIIEISGFPDEMEANAFVMFADFSDPNDNNFIKQTKPAFQLHWKFEPPVETNLDTESSGS